MRMTKRLILLLLVLSLSLGLFGCELPFLSPDGNDGDSGEPFTVYRLEWRNPHPEKTVTSVSVVGNGKYNTDVLLLRLCSI